MSNERPAQVRQEDLLDRADVIDGAVRVVLAHLDLTRRDARHERTIDVLMAVSRAADALRALAREDFPAAEDATRSMAHYTDRARG